MPSWPWTDHPCPHTGGQVIIIIWLANTTRWPRSSQKKLYLVMDLIFRSHGWLKTIFCSECGRACWCPGCPGPRACQMVAAGFLAELRSHPETPGALGPVSLPHKPEWLIPVCCTNIIIFYVRLGVKKSWDVLVLETIPDYKERCSGRWIAHASPGLGSPSMLCWGGSCPRKQGHLCDWVIWEFTLTSHWPSPLRDNPADLNTWESKNKTNSFIQHVLIEHTVLNSRVTRADKTKPTTPTDLTGRWMHTEVPQIWWRKARWSSGLQQGTPAQPFTSTPRQERNTAGTRPSISLPTWGHVWAPGPQFKQYNYFLWNHRFIKLLILTSYLPASSPSLRRPPQCLTHFATAGEQVECWFPSHHSCRHEVREKAGHGRAGLLGAKHRRGGLWSVYPFRGSHFLSLKTFHSELGWDFYWERSRMGQIGPIRFLKKSDSAIGIITLDLQEREEIKWQETSQSQWLWHPKCLVSENPETFWALKGNVFRHKLKVAVPFLRWLEISFGKNLRGLCPWNNQTL